MVYECSQGSLALAVIVAGVLLSSPPSAVGRIVADQPANDKPDDWPVVKHFTDCRPLRIAHVISEVKCPDAAYAHCMFRTLAAILLTFLLLAACGEQGTPAPARNAAETTSAQAPAQTPPAETTERFTIRFPSSWQVSRNRMGMALIATAPLDGPDDVFSENVNINEIANPRGLDVQAFYKQQFRVDVAREKLTNFQLVSESEAMVGGRPARRTVYRHQAGQFQLTALVYTVVTNSHGYVITCSVENDWFNDYREIFEQAIATFRAE